MAEQVEIKKISEYEWQIPRAVKMNVPAVIYASEKLLRDMQKDITLEQARNMAMLQGVLKNIVVLPDAHQGYGACIGGVGAFGMDDGVISPGFIGYDINCSIRLLKTDLTVNDFLKKRTQILNDVFINVPSGVGRAGKIRLTRETTKDVLEQGAKWAVKNGYGIADDLKKTEEEGCMKTAKASEVSNRAIERGMPQLGSLGAGNHFLEIQQVEQIYDEKIAKAFGITEKGQVTIMIHCGSRGLGHQVASDYIKLMEDKYGWENLPDRELINAPIKSELGQKYLSAMNCAVNFAFANRQMIMNHVREQLKYYFPKSEIKLVYDVCHNIAKIETHVVDGKKMKLCVHRKGATRAFAGQPVIIPGSMGTASYLLVGTKKAEELSFGSTAHCAGRVESRTSARRELTAEGVRKELSDKDIIIEAGSMKGLVEEAPEVYKDIDEVVRVSHEAGIGNIVARLVPLAVMKG